MLLSFKKSAAHADKTPRGQHLGFWRGLVYMIVSIFVVVMIVISLWVSVGAIIEKSKISRGVSQIIDILDLSRRFADYGREHAMTEHEDILAILARSRQIEVGGSTSDGLRTLVNPWGGTVSVYAAAANLLRIETVVPSRACVHIIGLLTRNINSLGLTQIDAKGSDQSLRQIYAERGQMALTADQISAGCHSDQFVILDLTFTLR